MAITVEQVPSFRNWSKNPVVFKFSSNTTGQSNFKIGVRVEMQDEDLAWRVLGADLHLPLIDDIASVDISYMLDAFFRFIFTRQTPIPYQDSTVPELATTYKQFRVSYWERYGDPPADQDIDGPDAYWVYFGESRKDLDYSTFFTFGINALGKILSNYPVRKTVDEESHEFLPFYSTLNNTEYQAKVGVYFTDGSFQNRTINAIDKITLNEGDIAHFPVGYSQLNLDQVNTAKTVHRWTVNIEIAASNAAVTVVYTYYMDCLNRECRHELVYLNLYGMASFFRTTGAWERLLNVSRQKAVALLAEKNWRTRDFQASNINDNTWNAKSGYITKAEAIALEELHVSDITFELKGIYLYHLLFLSKKYSITECLRELHFWQAPLLLSDRLRLLFTVRRLQIFTTSVSGAFTPSITYGSGSGSLYWKDDKGNYHAGTTPSFDYSSTTGQKNVEALALNESGDIKFTVADLSSKDIEGVLDFSSIKIDTALNVSGNAITELIFKTGSVLTGVVDVSDNSLAAGVILSTVTLTAVTSFDGSDNSMDPAAVNAILAEFDRQVTTGSNTITLTGTNSAPDTSSGGIDGAAAKTSLQGKGYTVNTN